MHIDNSARDDLHKHDHNDVTDNIRHTHSAENIYTKQKTNQNTLTLINTGQEELQSSITLNLDYSHNLDTGNSIYNLKLVLNLYKGHYLQDV